MHVSCNNYIPLLRSPIIPCAVSEDCVEYRSQIVAAVRNILQRVVMIDINVLALFTVAAGDSGFSC